MSDARTKVDALTARISQLTSENEALMDKVKTLDDRMKALEAKRETDMCQVKAENEELEADMRRMMAENDNVNGRLLDLELSSATLMAGHIGVVLIQRCAVHVVGPPKKGHKYHKHIHNFLDIETAAKALDGKSETTEAMGKYNALNIPRMGNALKEAAKGRLLIAHPICVHGGKCLELLEDDPEGIVKVCKPTKLELENLVNEAKLVDWVKRILIDDAIPFLEKSNERLGKYSFDIDTGQTVL